MITISGFKAAALAFAAAGASLSALAVPAMGSAATATGSSELTGAATASICIPCLEPCGPVCFINGAVDEASRAAGAAEDAARID